MRPRLFPVVVAAAWSWPVQAQQLGGAQAPDISIVRIIAALTLCLAAALALTLTLRARNRTAPFPALGKLRDRIAGSRRIDVLEARRLSPHADICLIRCDGMEFLILCGAGSGQVLTRRNVEHAAGSEDTHAAE